MPELIAQISNERCDRILFLSELDGTAEVHAINGDGTHRSAITNNWARQANTESTTEILSATSGHSLFTLDICSRSEWSPNGQSIAYESCGEHRDIWVMGADGSDKKNVTVNTSRNEQPTWSPDGDWFAFISDRTGTKSIFLSRKDGTELNQLTKQKIDAMLPRWSPDGSQVSYTSTSDGRMNICTIDIESATVKTLTNRSVDEGNAWWSPDGSMLAYTTVEDGKMAAYTMNADGSEQTRRTTNSSYNDTVYGWSPNGESLLIGSTRDENEDLYLFNLSSGTVDRLTSGAPEGKCDAWNACWTSIGIELV